MTLLTPIEKTLINGWQNGFPLTSNPYAQIADEMNVSEQTVLDILVSLKQRGILTRVGAVVRPNTIGASSLVAMAIEPDRLEEVADYICSIPQVNHNYERENKLNLWFVVTASSKSEVDEILHKIENHTSLKTIKLPLEKAFHIDLGFNI